MCTYVGKNAKARLWLTLKQYKAQKEVKFTLGHGILCSNFTYYAFEQCSNAKPITLTNTLSKSFIIDCFNIFMYIGVSWLLYQSDCSIRVF